MAEPATTPPADTVAGYRALRAGSGWRRLDRDVLTVAGPDAAAYLQGQLSQDVAGLPPGASAWSLILAPTGRVDALVRVWRVAEDRFVLDTDGGWGEAVATRLTRFRLRTKADIETVDWPVIGVRGPTAAAPQQPGDVGVLDATWPGLGGFDLVGEGATAPPEVAEVDADAWEAARIEAGVPRNGAELTERTIPAEAGIVERTVSFTKGCYTGQELVARIDARGSHVARHLRGLRLGAEVPVGSTLVAVGGDDTGGKDVGTVTSVARSPALGWVALGYVARGVSPPATVRAGGIEVTVAPLPLVD